MLVKGNILDDHFGKEFEGLRFQRIVFQMAAVGSDAETRRGFPRSQVRALVLRAAYRRFRSRVPTRGPRGSSPRRASWIGKQKWGGL